MEKAIFVCDKGYTSISKSEVNGDKLSTGYYVFSEGENRNVLTLTDEEEIASMRAFIKKNKERGFKSNAIYEVKMAK